MNNFLLLLITILPTIILGKIIYNKDKDKEPINLLLSLFLYGVLSAILVIFLTPLLSLFFPFFEREMQTLNYIELAIYVFFGIALVEELAKWIFTYKFAYKSNEFDQLYDVIVYASFVSLGFATIENALYVSSSDLLVGFIRAIASVPGHAFYGVFMGYYLGMAKILRLNGQISKSNYNLSLSILIPTLLHGIFDYTLFTGHWVFIIIFVIFLIFLYSSSFKKIKQFSKAKSFLKNRPNNFCSKCGTKIDGQDCQKCGSSPTL